ncbi:MAG: HD domain-containing protein [Spirochaetes bacterium]|nr:HD domain-containing protein [Spirochaetota bacterium]
MKNLKAILIKALCDFFENDYRRIEHALKVTELSGRIAAEYGAFDYELLTAACILHDIGIKKSEEVLGYNNGKTQEEYGPAEAEKILKSINFPAEKISKVLEIIGNHHSPSRYDYIELKILKQSDQIINSAEME